MAILPFGSRGRSRDSERADRSAILHDQRIRQAFDCAPVGLAVATLDGHWLLFNDTCCSLLGYKREELVHFSLNDITHPEDARKELAMIRRLIAGDAHRYQLEKRTIDKSGAYRTHSVTAVLVRSTSSEPDVFVFSIETPQGRVETGHDAERLAATILQSLSDTAIIRTDAVGNITGWNAGGERILGYTRDEILGRNRRQLFRDQDNWEDKPLVNLRLAREQGTYSCTDWRVRRDGSHVWLKSIVRPFAPDGTVRGYVEILSAPTDTDSIDTSSALEQLRAQLKAERVTTISLQERFEQLNTRAVSKTREIQVLASELRTEVERRKALEDELAALRAQLEIAANPPAPEPPAPTWLAPAAAVGIYEQPPTEWVDLAGHDPIRLVIDAAGSLRTGALIVSSGRAHKAMFFREGRLCCVASDSLDYQLGERLVSHGSITEEQRLEALEFSERTDLAFGRSLIALGFLTFDQVTDAIRAKIEAEIDDFASWSECHWVFVEREPPGIKLIQLSVDVRDLRAVRLATETVVPLVDTAEAPAPAAKKTRKPSARYVTTANGTKYHRPKCALIARIAKESLIRLATKREAKEKKLEPCSKCV
jgi:PAS domain S-box-containing protein